MCVCGGGRGGGGGGGGGGWVGGGVGGKDKRSSLCYSGIDGFAEIKLCRGLGSNKAASITRRYC